MAGMTPTDPIIGPSRGDLATFLAYATKYGAARPEFVKEYAQTVQKLCQPADMPDDAVVLGQGAVETGQVDGPAIFVSEVFKNRGNPAGMGWTGDAAQNAASPIFTSGDQAARAHVAHLVLYATGNIDRGGLTPGDDPRYDAYVTANGKKAVATTVAGLAMKWAMTANYAQLICRRANAIWPHLAASGVDAVSPSGDNTSPGGQNMTGYVTIGNRPLRIAVGAGHHNSSGGDEFEAQINGQVTNELVKLLKASDGFEVRCYTPQDGLGWYQGSLDQAAGQVNTWLDQGWAADILHEIHHEGVGGSAQPSGALCIYPDGAGLNAYYPNPGDTDLDVQAAAPAMSAAIAKAIGVPVRTFGNNPPGVMSERQSGVGEQGYRLGIFGRWAVDYFINNSCRFISEAAVYTNPGERKIMQAAGFPAKEAVGIANAYVALATSRMGWTARYQIGKQPTGKPPAGPPPPDPTYPPHADLALAKTQFGQIVNDLGDFHFDPHGPVSTAWLHHWKATGNAPTLETVVARGAGKLFAFAGGLLIYADSQQAIVVKDGA